MLPIILSDRLRGELERLEAHTPSAKERCRAQALLWLDDGRSAGEVADLLHVSRQSVYNWRDRFRQREGLDLRGRLLDAPRCGSAVHQNVDVVVVCGRYPHLDRVR